MTLRSSSAAETIPVTSAEVNEVTRFIGREVSEVLWGRAAGRCEFQGCNEPLWKSPVTQEPVKIAERAHIYAFGKDGPRSKAEFRAAGLNGLSNLLLVCRNCHRTIDQHKDGRKYSVEVLQAMKQSHESRIELVTNIVPSVHSHVLLYSTSVGDHQLLPSFNDAASAMFPHRLPTTDRPIELGLHDSARRDHDAAFWSLESSQLKLHFERRVRDRTRASSDRIEHLSVFAIAPQPLLMLLGTLLGDIVPANIHQRRREPATWGWRSDAEPLTLQVSEPEENTGTPALILGLSGTVTEDRIERVLGSQVSIWRVTVDSPHNDILEAEAQLKEWRTTLRKLFDRIKAVHGQQTTLHIFPAIPVSAAIEVGRVRMPKADMPWQLYDQINNLGGFIPAITIT
jgi:hypothetical protein